MHAERKLCYLLTMSFLSVAMSSVQASDSPRLNVSMIQLIANPQEYNGKQVRFTGFASIAFEDVGLYPNSEDHQAGIIENKIDILAPNAVMKKYTVDDGKYVLVEATFHATYNKEGGIWTRSIDKITRFEQWGSLQGK